MTCDFCIGCEETPSKSVETCPRHSWLFKDEIKKRNEVLSLETEHRVLVDAVKDFVYREETCSTSLVDIDRRNEAFKNLALLVYGK